MTSLVEIYRRFPTPALKEIDMRADVAYLEAKQATKRGAA